MSTEVNAPDSKRRATTLNVFRRTILLSALALVCALPSFGNSSAAQAEKERDGREWPSYAGTNASTKYSSLDRINAGNAASLRIAWRWESPDAQILRQHPKIKTWKFEATPIMVGGVLYTSTSLNQVVALDPVRGRTIWIYDPKVYEDGSPVNFGFTHRGVSFWTDGKDQRILFGTGNGFLMALDARTGKPVLGFGENGLVDLTNGLGRPVDRSLYGVNSPVAICKDTIIVGSTVVDFPKVKPMPPGDVRAFDVRTGKLRWTFHTIPHRNENGSETWPQDAYLEFGAANVWPPMSVDDALGYVYLPVSSPSGDFYGGGRPGDNLFAESLVCLDALTGRRVWHFQMVHHGLWDRDPPAAPILTDIRVGSKTVRAVTQVTKQGFVYVVDRVSGRPVWPVIEEPVPKSTVPGEHSARTQPIPTRPAAFDLQGLSIKDLIDFTPALNQEARRIVSQLDYGPLFSPPTLKGSVIIPGVRGGASWAGAAYDPESDILYVPSITAPSIIRLVADQWLQWPKPSYKAGQAMLTGPQGLPITKPPYGRVTAISLQSGERIWMQPMGDGPKNHPALRGLHLGRLGWPYRGFPLVTKALLFIAQEGPIVDTTVRSNGVDGTFSTVEPTVQVFNKCTGALLTEVPIPSNASGSPMTYMAGQRQYVVVPVGGGQIPAELVAMTVN